MLPHTTRTLLRAFCLPLVLLALAFAGPSAAGALTVLEKDAHERVNAARVAHGLAPLQYEPQLTELAREHSRRMHEKGFFDHTDPEHGTVARRAKAAGVSYRGIGENLAFSENAPDPAATVIEGWLQSPDHRANILDARFTEAGLGVWRDGRSYWFTQIFRAPLRD
jgi:uncharacterized protein YkwD